MLVVLALVVGAIEPRFLTGQTARIVLLAIPLVLVAAMGEMMVIVARHVDLSIGSMLGFSAIVAGMIFRDHPNLPLIRRLRRRARHRARCSGCATGSR